VPLVFEALQRGELVEPFGASGRIGSPFSYWMLVSTASRGRSEVQEFGAWVEAQAAATRAAVETSGRTPTRGDPPAPRTVNRP
jgi:LysR family glycine cleavage system transcriptional activator